MSRADVTRAILVFVAIFSIGIFIYVSWRGIVKLALKDSEEIAIEAAVGKQERLQDLQASYPSTYPSAAANAAPQTPQTPQSAAPPVGTLYQPSPRVQAEMQRNGIQYYGSSQHAPMGEAMTPELAMILDRLEVLDRRLQDMEIAAAIRMDAGNRPVITGHADMVQARLAKALTQPIIPIPDMSRSPYYTYRVPRTVASDAYQPPLPQLISTQAQQRGYATDRILTVCIDPNYNNGSPYQCYVDTIQR